MKDVEKKTNFSPKGGHTSEWFGHEPTVSVSKS